MNELISSFMELARDLSPEAHGQPARPLIETLQKLQEDHSTGAAEITLKLNGNCWELTECRASQALYRVLENLLGNAIRYAENSPISIIANCGLPSQPGQLGQPIKISITDHGPGIPQDQLEAVFRPFQRLEASRSRHSGGSGLGLAIARQIARAHGWSLTLHNMPQGGLEASLSIPLPDGEWTAI